MHAFLHNSLTGIYIVSPLCTFVNCKGTIYFLQLVFLFACFSVHYCNARSAAAKTLDMIGIQTALP